jgi:hypothetical protein
VCEDFSTKAKLTPELVSASPESKAALAQNKNNPRQKTMPMLVAQRLAQGTEDSESSCAKSAYARGIENFKFWALRFTQQDRLHDVYRSNKKTNIDKIGIKSPTVTYIKSHPFQRQANL